MRLVCADESILIYDSTRRSVWARRGSKPHVLVTGSHRRVYLFGALTSNRRHLFRQYPKMNGCTFTEFLHQLRRRYGRLILLIDKAPWHRSKPVRGFLAENRSSLRVLYFPANAPEMNPVEECLETDEERRRRLNLPPNIPTTEKRPHQISTNKTLQAEHTQILKSLSIVQFLNRCQ